MPDVFEVRRKHAHGQVIGQRVFTAEVVNALGRHVCITGIQFMAIVGRGRTVTTGEVSGVEVQPFNFAAQQVEASRCLRRGASTRRGQDGVVGLQVAIMQFSLGKAGLDRRACATEIILRPAVAADRQVARVRIAFATIQFHAPVSVSIHTKADSALGKAGGEVALHHLQPVLFVARRIFTVTIKIKVAK